MQRLTSSQFKLDLRFERAKLKAVNFSEKNFIRTSKGFSDVFLRCSCLRFVCQIQAQRTTHNINMEKKNI